MRARTRTADAMLAKARAHHVTGGRVFGYDNVRLAEGYVVCRINEAEVVRVIYIWYADGLGLRSIVHRLNEQGALAPLPRRADRPRGWSVSSLHAVLRRELYVGRVVWNKSAKRDRWGQKRATTRPATDWISYDAPELQIVSRELWQRVQHRLRQVRRNYTRHTPAKHLGQPSAPVETTHALLGFAACGACGGAIIVHGRSHGPSVSNPLGPPTLCVFSRDCAQDPGHQAAE